MTTFDEVCRAYADSLGVEELSMKQKQMVLLNYILENDGAGLPDYTIGRMPEIKGLIVLTDKDEILEFVRQGLGLDDPSNH